METKQGGEMVIRAMGAKAACVEALVREVNKLGENYACCHHVRVYDEDILTITYNHNAPKILMDDILRRCVEELDESIYAMENCTLEQQLVSLLKIRGPPCKSSSRMTMAPKSLSRTRRIILRVLRPTQVLRRAQEPMVVAQAT